jgi:arylformamidase
MNWSSAPDVVDEDIDIEGDSITDDALAEALVADLRLLMVGEVQILNKEIIEERHKRTPSTAGPASGS